MIDRAEIDLSDDGVWKARWPNFRPAEFVCRCAKCRAVGGRDAALVFMLATISPQLLDALQGIRDGRGFGLKITSGVRCKNHPAEARKKRPGTGAHCGGAAADVACSGPRAFAILRAAMADESIVAIGVKQTGVGRFLHLEVASKKRPQPTVWSY